ncbi:hypothetical protein TYRP_008910 [Tyrophagus putrescentiae]|nr:hypothetical protein TYRP_008910 [Tyrophagus putrescentiae]
MTAFFSSSSSWFLRDRYRHVIAVMIFSCTFAAYISRVNLTVTIVHMAKGKDIEKVFQDGSLRGGEKRYDWDETDQGQILSSFYLLYLSMQIPGGRLIDRFGPRRLCSLALLGTGVINLLLPLLVEHSYLLFIGSRILMGGLQATVFSSCYALVARWTPEQERSTVISLTSIGSAFGSMVTSSLSGHLCAHHGWPLVFHLSGLVITAIGLLYLVLVTDEPASSPYVSPLELASSSGTKKSNFPWWTVLRSRPLLAVITVKLTMGLVYNLVMLKLPSYLSQVLRMDIEEVGLLQCTDLRHLVFGYTADSLLTARYFRCKTTLRKTFQTIAVFGTSQCLLLLSSANCDRAAFLAVILLGMTFFGLQAGGEMVVYADLTTDYSATVFAIAQTVGLVAGFVPQAMGPVLDRNPEFLKRTWWEVFNFIALFNLFGGVVFLAAGSAEPQHWEDLQKEEDKRVENGMKVMEEDGGGLISLYSFAGDHKAKPY